MLHKNKSRTNWTDAFSCSFKWPLSITRQGFKEHKRAITEQFNLSCFCAHTPSARAAPLEVAVVTANSPSSHLTNSSQMITFGPPSDKVISQSLLLEAWGRQRPVIIL